MEGLKLGSLGLLGTGDPINRTNLGIPLSLYWYFRTLYSLPQPWNHQHTNSRVLVKIPKRQTYTLSASLSIQIEIRHGQNQRLDSSILQNAVFFEAIFQQY